MYDSPIYSEVFCQYQWRSSLQCQAPNIAFMHHSDNFIDMKNYRLSSLILMLVHRSFDIHIEDVMGLQELKATLDGTLLTSDSAPVFVTNFMGIF